MRAKAVMGIVLSLCALSGDVLGQSRRAGPAGERDATAARTARVFEVLKAKGVDVGRATARADASVFPRHRSTELSPTSLLVVAVDARKRLVGWTVIHDPRVIRAEFPDESGELSGTVIVRDDVEIVVPVPESDVAVEVLVFAPRWSDEETLDLTLVDRVATRFEERQQ